ncbi:uncharacterized protein LOC119072968 [Bradysia coprophila]|uniref:uncharacterized protein LOC119072968 n=1 Tax=Bradysia coprophila TaxID=38358 RepID=UPI00187DC49B|nr:uncharacterized protein LOC119072968 [Bradysia coprophila]
MEAVHKNSINSTIDSQVSNLSTARLLIDYIKSLVEDDMKSTLEAFKLIESEIDVELKSTVSTIPKKTFVGNRISRTRSCTSSPQPKKTDKRNSLQPNFRVPSAASSKRSVRKSLLAKPVLDSHFESDNTIDANSNYDSYDSPHSPQAKLRPDDEEFEYFPEATSTPVKRPFSSPSIDENRSVPSCEQSESTITNPYSYQNDGQPYSDNSKLLTVEAMYQDLKADLNRIFQRFAQESSESNSQIKTTNSNKYNDASGSLFCDQTSQTSLDTSRRSTAANNRYVRGIVLPQLLAFGDNWNNNLGKGNGKGLTIISEPFSQPDRDIVDEVNKKMNERSNRHNLWSNGFENGAEEKGKMNHSDDGNKITEAGKPLHENSNGTRNSITTNQKPTDSEGEYVKSVDLKVLPESGGNNTNNYVTLTDIEESIPETMRDEGLTSICSESSATNNISSSLIATPKTMNDSPNDCTDLDEIALLISLASPSKRVVIKKVMPGVAVKGYNRNCDEKLIFSGDKVTHVKTDRKVICRKYDPK